VTLPLVAIFGLHVGPEAVGVLASLGTVPFLVLKLGVDNVLGVSLRQRLTGIALQGRMNATFRVILSRALSIRGRPVRSARRGAWSPDAVWVGAAAAATAGIAVLPSPVRGRLTLPEQVAEHERVARSDRDIGVEAGVQ
jgi:hypothetical protein